MSKSSVVRNVYSNWIGLAVNMAAAFIMSPFLVHRLGDAMYGIWVLLLSVTGYMGLLDAGLKVSVVKYVSRYAAIKDTDNLSRVISTAMALYGLVSVLVMAVAVLMVPLLPRIFTIPAEMQSTASFVLMITAANLSVTLVLSVFNGVLSGLQRYDYANKVNVIIVIVRSVAIVGLVGAGFGVIALGLIHLASQLITGALMARLAYRELPSLQIRMSLVGKGTAQTLYGYSFFVLLNNAAMFLLFSSGEILIGVMLSTAAITYYAIAGSLLQHLGRMVGTMTQVLHPYASAQDARGDTAALKRTVVLGTKACILIALPASVAFMLIGRPFITFWMGASYAEVAAPVAVAMTVGRLFWLSQSSTGNVLLGIGRHKLLTVVNLLTGILSIALGAALTPKFGLFGLAVGMSIPMVISQGLVLPRLTTTIFDISGREYWQEAYMQPIVATIPFGLVLWGLLTLMPPRDVFSLAAIVVASAPAFIAPAYFICFTPEQRRAVTSRFTFWPLTSTRPRQS